MKKINALMGKLSDQHNSLQIIGRLLIFLCIFMLLFTAGGTEAADFRTITGANLPTITVSNAKEFLEALGSNRIIDMDYTGDYNLSEWEFSDDLKLAEGVRWSGVFDGAELVLSGIKNLTIKGGGPDGANSQITVNPRYAYVMKFENCSDIVIDGPMVGHSEDGDCEGGVFSFTDSSRITIQYTEMYGSGTEGLTLSNVSDMKVKSSNIYNCTYHIMTVNGGENIAFEDNMFMFNQEFTLVNVSRTKNMSFSNCYFNDNQGEMFDVQNTTISVSNSSFNRNKTDSPIQGNSNVKFTDCEFN